MVRIEWRVRPEISVLDDWTEYEWVDEGHAQTKVLWLNRSRENFLDWFEFRISPVHTTVVAKDEPWMERGGLNG